MNDLIKYIQDGLCLDDYEPFKKIAEELGCCEEEIFKQLQEMKDTKKIKRFGPVLFNRRIGLDQNAMTTLEVAPENIEKAGRVISTFEFVTLCYERAPVHGVWDYNLYFMIHGSDRTIVKDQIQQVINALGREVMAYQVLFSSRCFKQKGANY